MSSSLKMMLLKYALPALLGGGAIGVTMSSAPKAKTAEEPPCACSCEHARSDSHPVMCAASSSHPYQAQETCFTLYDCHMRECWNTCDDYAKVCAGTAPHTCNTL
jgi:hypothetical protein